MILFNNVFTTDQKANEILMKHVHKRFEWQMKNVYKSYDPYSTGIVYENNKIFSAIMSEYFPFWVKDRDRDKFFEEVYKAVKAEEYIDISREPSGLMYEFVLSHVISKLILHYKRYGLPEELKLSNEEKEICLKAIKEDIMAECDPWETPRERLERYLSLEDFTDNFFWDEDYLLLYSVRKEHIQNSFLNKVAGIV